VELVLIRHGEPDWEAARRGQADPGLTDLGRRQVADLAKHLEHVALAALYSSPLQRARETAEVIGTIQRLTAVVADGVAEIGVPVLFGASQTEVDAYFAAAAKRPFREHWEGFPGGEPFHEFHARVSGAIEALLGHYAIHSQIVDG